MEAIKYCRLIETLKTFNPEEFSDFEKIAASPFFSKGRNYLPYIKALKKHFPKFEKEVFRKSNARKYIFKLTHPGKTYNDQYMKNIFSDLINFAEETLFQRIAKKHSLQNLSFLAIEEAKRNLFPLASHNIQILDKKLEENGIDEIYFYCKGMNEIAYSVLYNKTHGKNHLTGKPFTTGTDFIFFSIITLALSIYNISERKDILVIDNEINLSENFSNFIDFEKLEKLLLNLNNQNKEMILIFVYYLLHKKYKSNYIYYEKMRNLLFRNYPKFNSRMLFYVTSILLSTLYDIKDKLKEEIFRKEYHKIAVFSLDNRCYKIMKSAIFQFIRFRAYYLNALELGETEWVQDFANRYLPELPPELQDETLRLVNSNLLFRQKQYEESLDGLKFKCKNLYSKIDQRILKLKIYFHKRSLLHAEESLESFKKFINNNMTSKHTFRGNFSQFIKYYKKLLDATEGKESESETVLHELKKTYAFAESRWLIENFDCLTNNLIHKKYKN